MTFCLKSFLNLLNITEVQSSFQLRQWWTGSQDFVLKKSLCCSLLSEERAKLQENKTKWGNLFSKEPLPQNILESLVSSQFLTLPSSLSSYQRALWSERWQRASLQDSSLSKEHDILHTRPSRQESRWVSFTKILQSLTKISNTH